MTKLPQRHWRSYGNDPLPTPADALAEPFRAFPSWFLRIECDRCGRVQMVNEAHAKWRDRTLRDILARMRHDGCGGLAAKAELLTGIEGVSSRPVRRIVLRVAERRLDMTAQALVRRRYSVSSDGYGQGNRSAMNRRKPTLANWTRRAGSGRTQVANSFIVSLRFGAGLGRQILVPSEF